MLRVFKRSLALSLGVACASPALQAGPITFVNSLPVSSGQLIYWQRFMALQAREDPSPMNRDMRALVAPTVIIYGWTPEWTLMGVLPTQDVRVDLDSPGGRVRREVQGVGDLMLAVRYTALAIDRPGETLRLAPLLGLSLPTGAEHKGDDHGPLPRLLQPGSGAWNPMAGAVFSWQTLAWELDVSGTYQRRNEAEGFKAGDEGRLDGSFQKRIWHGHAADGVPSYLYAVLETNAVWRGQNRVRGVEDRDTGGTSFYLTPGLQFVSRRFVLDVAYQFPIQQRLHCQALKGDSTLHMGVRFQF